MTSLFDPTSAGALHPNNRIVMAPLTRNRAPGAIPTPLMATHYRQRASAGLLITEATAISHQGQGYADVPGIWSDEQVAGWKQVTDAGHAAGGRIVVQLWHVGRVSHTSLQPDGQKPVAPSAIAAKTKTFILQDGAGAFVDTSEPRALTLDATPGPQGLKAWTWWPLAAPSLPTPTWCSACAKMRRSTRPTAPPFTAAARRVTPTIPR